MLEVGTDPKDWHELASGRRWGHAREARARDVARRRVERARADWQSLHQVALRGEDARAWATEQGWDDARIQSAARFANPVPRAETTPNHAANGSPGWSGEHVLAAKQRVDQ